MLKEQWFQVPIKLYLKFNVTLLHHLTFLALPWWKFAYNHFQLLENSPVQFMGTLILQPACSLVDSSSRCLFMSLAYRNHIADPECCFLPPDYFNGLVTTYSVNTVLIWFIPPPLFSSPLPLCSTTPSTTRTYLSPVPQPQKYVAVKCSLIHLSLILSKVVLRSCLFYLGLSLILKFIPSLLPTNSWRVFQSFIQQTLNGWKGPEQKDNSETATIGLDDGSWPNVQPLQLQWLTDGILANYRIIIKKTFLATRRLHWQVTISPIGFLIHFRLFAF